MLRNSILKAIGFRRFFHFTIFNPIRQYRTSPKKRLHTLNFFCIRSLSTTYTVTYKLTFVTGDERGADSDANIHACLIGERGELPVPIDNTRIQITRNSEAVVTFQRNNHDIGIVKSIKVGHDAEGTGSGWYLEKIILKIIGALDDKSIEQACSISNRDTDLCFSSVDVDKKSIMLEFPFYGWLGTSDSGGHDGPLTAEILPLPVSRWSNRETITEKDVALVLERASKNPVALKMAGYCIPHPDKVTQGSRSICGKYFGYGGEDSYFAHPSGLMGVADGIYAWRSSGIDSGLYSRALMQGALERASRAAEEGDFISAMDLFHAAVEKANTSNTLGSSTVCIFGLVPLSVISCWMKNPRNASHSVNLGATIASCVNLGNAHNIYGLFFGCLIFYIFQVIRV